MIQFKEKRGARSMTGRKKIVEGTKNIKLSTDQSLGLVDEGKGADPGSPATLRILGFSSSHLESKRGKKKDGDRERGEKSLWD